MSAPDAESRLSDEDVEFLIALLRSSAAPLTTAELIDAIRTRIR
jgi:hypothetical protein